MQSYKVSQLSAGSDSIALLKMHTLSADDFLRDRQLQIVDEIILFDFIIFYDAQEGECDYKKN